jgi:hypothetical protein
MVKNEEFICTIEYLTTYYTKHCRYTGLRPYIHTACEMLIVGQRLGTWPPCETL